jgi:hypothetical protein
MIQQSRLNYQAAFEQSVIWQQNFKSNLQHNFPDMLS